MLNSTATECSMIWWGLVRVVSMLVHGSSVVSCLFGIVYSTHDYFIIPVRVLLLLLVFNFTRYYLVICNHCFLLVIWYRPISYNWWEFSIRQSSFELSIFSWFFLFIHYLVDSSIVFIVTDTVKKVMKWNVENWWQTVHWLSRFVIGEVGWWE